MRLGMIGFAGLFSGSFWSGLRYQTPQAIEEQLKKQSPSLSVLLNQEEVIQQVKTGSNTKLQQFIANNLFEMIDLITVMPQSDVHQRGHKFPFVAAQILNCDSQIILDAFFKAPQSQDLTKTTQKQEDEEVLSNEDFEGDGQGVAEINTLNDVNFYNKDGDNDSYLKLDKKERYQDGDDDNEIGDEEYEQNKFQQEEENDDKGPLLIKDIQVQDVITDETAQQISQVVDNDEKNDDKEVTLDNDAVASQQASQQKVDQKDEQNQDDKQQNQQQSGEENQQGGEQENDQNQESNEDKPTDCEAIFNEDQEEKALPTLQTVESTTCETHQRYKFQYMVYLFKFLENKQNRPSSPNQSIASETTTATNTEQENTETTASQIQEKKLNEEDYQLNNVLSGYFAKLVIHFVIKRPKEFFTFLSEKPQCLYNMTQHLYSRALSDSLMKILICENHGIQDSGMSLYQEMRKNVIGKILDYIDVKNSPNGIQNSVNILIELASRRPCFDIIVQPLMIEPFFAKLFDGIDNIIDKKREEEGEDDKASLPSIVQVLRRQGVRLVSYLMQNYSNFILKDANKNEEDKKDKKDDDDLEKEDVKENFTDDDQVVIGANQMEDYDKNQDSNKDSDSKKDQDSDTKDKDDDDQAEEAQDNKVDDQKNKQQEKEGAGEADTENNNEPNPFIECIYENFDNLIKFLSIKPFETIDTISGQVMQPFGAIRISTIEILVVAVKINENALNNKIIESKILTKLLHFFGEYEWNSILHFKLDLLFLHIINKYQSCEELFHSLIQQSHLIEYVLQLALADPYKLQNQTSREIERGFFPYIFRIIEALKRQSEKSSFISDYIKAHENEWNKVWTQKIEPKQKKYSKLLGGVNPNVKKNQNKNQTDGLTLPSAVSSDSKKDSDDDDNNNKFSSFDKMNNDDDDQDNDNPQNEPEEEIRNRGDLDDDDDDDDDDDNMGSNARYSYSVGAKRANMLSSNDSIQRHKDFYVQTNNKNSDEDYDDNDDDDDMGRHLSFQGWNVDDPKTLLQKEQRSKKKEKNSKKGRSDLNKAFDSKRDDDVGNFYMDDEDQYDKSGQDYPNFEFNSLRNEYDSSSSGGFSADEFGSFQSGEDFYDANTFEQLEQSKTQKQQEVPQFNDFNFWKPAPAYDLNQLMSEM